MTRKELFWVGSSYADFPGFPERARIRLSRDLLEVQLGNRPSSWRPMNIVGAGAVEIRVSADGTFRLLYVTKFAEGIYVLHVFQTKSRKTPQLDIEVARARFKAVCRMRGEG